MQDERFNLDDFFKQCEQLNNQRGTFYDGKDRSAYQIPLDMVSPKNKYLISVAPVLQKASRLAIHAQKSQNEEFDPEAWSDTLKDLANYAALAWLEIVKPALDNEKDTVIKHEDEKSKIDEVVVSEKESEDEL